MKVSKSFLIILLIIVCSFSQVFSQSQYWGYERCGETLNKISMVNNLNGYAIGQSGQVRYTSNGGSTWKFSTIPWNSVAPVSYFGLWSFNENNVWLTGERGTVLKWNGSTWVNYNFTAAPFNTVTFNSIYGISNSDIWAVSDKNYTEHFDGTSWTYFSSTLNFTSSLKAVWMAASNNAWAVGSNGNIIHWDGSAWAIQTSGTTQTIWDVWGTDATHVWASTTTGEILFYNGTSWSIQLASTGNDDYMKGLWGTSNTDVWAVGYITGGTTAGSHIYHYDGTTWVLTNTIPNRFFLKGQSIDATNFWVVGSGGSIYKGNGTTLAAQKDETNDNGFRCAWSADYNNSWMAGGKGGIMKWDGTVWTQQVTASAANSDLYGMWGLSTTSIWTVGANGIILKYDGTNWTPQVSGTGGYPLYSVWALDANNVWAVGANGIILKYNGTTWAPQSSGVTNYLLGVWGTDANNIWAVGEAGIILKYNGTTWAPQSSGLGTNISLSGVWGLTSNNVYACGTDGKFLKYNGSTWTTIFNNSTQPLNAIWGRDASKIYATGNGSAIFIWNGTTLTNDYSPQILSSYTIIPRDANSIFAASSNSIITTKTVTGLSVLPVRWKDFTGAVFNEKAVLKWSTLSEINNKGFNVQKSFDGHLFKTIGFVKGQNLADCNYTFTDLDFVLNKNNFYRLFQIDLDGRQIESKIIRLKSDDINEAVYVYPNPVHNTLFIQNMGFVKSIKIFDLSGKLIKQINTNTSQIDVSDLSKGLYFLQWKNSKQENKTLSILLN